MTIVIAGGTGRLGSLLVERFRARGEEVRVLSRAPEHAGDVRDPAALDRALAGARLVISAFSAFGMKGVSPRLVDGEGNVNLIAAAEKHGVGRFVLVSALRASADHPMELARMKHLAEQRLVASKLSWTILRPSTFTETFQMVLCAPLLEKGKTVVFGRAENPINFVSVHDVARFVELASAEPSLVGEAIDIGGPENLSLVQFVETFRSAVGATGSVKHIPRFMMRFLSHAARPFQPTFARMVQAGVVMDTTDMSFDAGDLRRRFPAVSLTTVAEVARRDYGPSRTAEA
jgi:uncharacterized protein YbjT (DUF2867 family)